MLVLVSGLGWRRPVVDDVSLRCSYLNGWFGVGIFDSINHTIEMMRLDDDLAGPNFGHRIFGRIFAFKLLPFRFLWFCPISFEDAIA